jgi:ssDNA-binding Zn-finger/Zn-ribbon topoisomerase 1
MASTTPDGSSRTPCPKCGRKEVVLGTQVRFFVYLRCCLCHEVWAIPERRKTPRDAARGIQLGMMSRPA